MKAGTTTSSLGNFTVLPVLETAITNQSVVLSDKDGNCYYENTAGTQKYNANDSNAIGTTYATAQIKFTISYSGALSTAAEVLAAWNEAAGDDFVVTLSDTTAWADGVPSAALVTYYGGAGNSAVRGTGLGLKFQDTLPTRSADGWKNDTSAIASHNANSLASSTFSLDNPGTFVVSGNNGSYTATVTSAIKATFYIGIVGIDGVAQTASDTYSCSFAVSGGGITA